jgi:purine-binding chemotaxis protein CheW
MATSSTKPPSRSPSSSSADAPPGLALVCRVRNRFCAVPVSEIDETLRPLPLEPMPSAPPFVSGWALVRGAPTPVVDAGALLGADSDASPTRLVVLRVGARRIALAVEAVVGLRTLPSPSGHPLPLLMSEVSADVVAALGALDATLAAVLRTARLLPEAVWTAPADGTA